LLAVTGTAAAAPGSPGGSQWSLAGGDLSDTHNQPTETKIGTGNVGQLAPKWTFQTTPGSGVWATPTVSGGVVYVPDSAGHLFAIDAATGQQLWDDFLPSLSPELPPDAFARTSPAVFGDELILGDQHPTNSLDGTGAHVLSPPAHTQPFGWCLPALAVNVQSVCMLADCPHTDVGRVVL
jgi:outer membrane protein assembly factor BamB